MPKISLQIAHELKQKKLPNKTFLTQIAKETLQFLKASGEIVIRLVDEAEGKFLNENYRKKEGATNVLSFSLQEQSNISSFLEGDIILCHPVIEKESLQEQIAIENHYAHLIIHGILHLLGYDHQTENEAIEMEKKETLIMQRLGLPNPYSVLENGNSL